MSLADVKLLMFVGPEYEDLEVWYPVLRLREEGATVSLAGQERGTHYRGKNGYPCTSELAIDEIDDEDFDGVILAGGWMPDKLRRLPKVKSIVASMAGRGKLVAAICHGGWMAISADVYRGVRVTGSPGIKDDLINAGAVFEDAPVVVDRNFISSRKPDDLPQFCREIIDFLERQKA